VNRARYSITLCEVTGHLEYGLLVHVAGTSEAGFVDRADIGDEETSPSRWPSQGTELRCVVLGYARNGRLRLSSRARDVALAMEVVDVAEALRDWINIRDTACFNRNEIVDFAARDYAVPVLRWALRNNPRSKNHAVASKFIEFLPQAIKDEIHRL
jgi:hypothetical protein